MRFNTPPHTPVHNLEEEVIEDEDDIVFLNDPDNPEGVSYDDDNDELHEVSSEEIFDYDENDHDDDGQRKPERDDSILTFKKHTGPVFCCSIHPGRNICVTGGEDEKAYVWDLTTGEIIYEIVNHKDTIISACFSHDGKYLATGDMLGEIQVFKLNSNFKKVWEFSMGDMCWLKWHTLTNVLMAGADSGEINAWHIPSGEYKVLPGRGERCETAELTNDGQKLFAGYGNGIVKLWDIRNCATAVEVNQNNSIYHHKECVSSVCCDPNKSLYASGSEDGVILLTSDSGPICTLNQSGGPVEVVSFCPDNDLKVLATGTLQGQVAIWDTTKQNLRTMCKITDANTNGNIENGITVLKWLPQKTIVCGTLNGSILGFDGRNGVQKFSLLGHLSELYDIQYCHRENILLTASEDCTAKIFRVSL